jgi:hypothetical protein
VACVLPHTGGNAIPQAFFALRAGALCTAMQRCINVPQTCVLKMLVGTANISAALDMCSAEGVAGGTQLPRVLTTAGEDTVCST